MTIAALCLFLYFLNPVKAHAAWVYFPPQTVISYVQANDPTTGVLYQISFVPIGTGVFDIATHKVVDIASLPIASQPPLNPIMVGMPVIQYGDPVLPSVDWLSVSIVVGFVLLLWAGAFGSGLLASIFKQGA